MVRAVFSGLALIILEYQVHWIFNHKEEKMKLSQPKKTTWWTALILGLVGILLHEGIVSIAVISGLSFWFVAVAFILLALATTIKGL
jgi:hypothetical protein